MIVVRAKGGLGNQLFQYAIGRNLAARHGVPLKLDVGWFHGLQDVPGLEMFARSFRLTEFNIVADIASDADVSAFVPRPLGKFDPRRIRGPIRRFRSRFPALCYGLAISERDLNFQPELLKLPDGIYLDGWWQSEGYFHEASQLLRRELTLRDPLLLGRASDYVSQRRRKGAPIVALHVRRGDVARAHEVLRDLSHMPYELLPKEYFRRAMTLFGKNVTYIVFSDTEADIAWCKANLTAPDMHFASPLNDLDDFAAMSHCDHYIISNSTFSWWAAWLNPAPDKIVVAPRQWFRRSHAPNHDIHSMIPNSWVIK